MIKVYTESGLFHPDWKDHRNDRSKWCKENCDGLVVSDILQFVTRWEFELDTDAMAFKLRWI